MTNERFVFQQDIRERSQMKSGAIHKKNGSKSKKCTMPSDHLTPAQKKKLNGECVNINLSKPITSFAELRKFPCHLQREYLQNLVTNYGARKIDICNMLNTNHSNLDRYLRDRKIDISFGPITRGRKSKMDERFLEFITRPDVTQDNGTNKKTDEQILEERFDIKQTKPSDNTPPDTSSIFGAMSSVRVIFDGSKKDILKVVEALLMEDREYKVFLDVGVKANS